MIQIKFKKLHTMASLPFQQWATDAGADLVVVEERRLSPGQAADVRCGIAVALPDTAWGLIIGRSSSIRKRGIEVLLGVIDPGYRGELMALCRNTTEAVVTIHPGERVAQLIVIPKHDRIDWLEAYSLEPGDRGLNGYGSTGGFADGQG